MDYESENKEKTKTPKLIDTENILGVARSREWEVVEMGERDKEIQMSS